jgi:spore maturation protein CgeB
MNILVIGKFYTEGFALHIAETLEAMGHSVRRFEPGYRSNRLPGTLGKRLDQALQTLHAASDNLPAVRARRMRGLWQAVDAAPLDLAIVGHDFLWPAEVAELKRRSGAQVALWFPDPIVNFHRALFMNAAYDALFFKDPFIVHRLGDVLESPAYYLPECFNPARHRWPEGASAEDPAYACDIATAGNLHSWRVACFKHLTVYEVKLWGHPPPLWMPPHPVLGMFQGRGVYNEEKARAFRGARIVVNTLLYGEIWGVNVRCFEAAGVGAFQMVDWRPGLGQLFKDGQELITFTGMADLKDKIDHWLPREAERRAIAAAGQRRALAEHTYRHRLELLLATLGGRAQGFPAPSIRYQVGHGASA